MPIHCTRHSKATRHRCRHPLKKTPRKFQNGDRVYAFVNWGNGRERISGIVYKASWQYFMICHAASGFTDHPLAGYQQAHWYYHMKYVDHPRAANGDGWAYAEEDIYAEPLDALARV